MSVRQVTICDRCGRVVYDTTYATGEFKLYKASATSNPQDLCSDCRVSLTDWMAKG